MNFTKQGLVYVLMIIPTLFAVAIFAQGVNKLSQDKPDGKIALGFGIFLLILVAATYFLFIR